MPSSIVNNPSGSGTFGAAWVTPAQIVGNQNDYDPGAGNAFRISSSSAVNLTGLDVNGNQDGDSIILRNIGAFAITLTNEDVGSAVAFRIITGLGASIPIDPDDSAILKYDGTTARWILTA